MTDTFRRNAGRSWLRLLLVLYALLAVATALLWRSAPLLFRMLTDAPPLNRALNLAIVAAFLVGLTLSFGWLFRAAREERLINRFAELNFGPTARPRGAETGWVLHTVGRSAIRDRVELMQELLRAGASWDGAVVADTLVDREEPRVAVARYSANTLVLLGLLGTFIGLLLTIGGITDVVDSLAVSASDDIQAFLIPLREGLKSPLEGMAVAFSTSLLGLGASLVLGAGALALSAAQSSWIGKLEQLTTLYLAPAFDARDRSLRQPSVERASTAPSVARVEPAATDRIALDRLEASLRFLRDAQTAVGDQLAHFDSTSERIASSLGDFRDRVALMSEQNERLETVLARVADGQETGRSSTQDLGRKLADLAGTASALKSDLRDGHGELTLQLGGAARALRDGMTAGLGGLATVVSQAQGVAQLGDALELLRADLNRAAAERATESRALAELLQRLDAHFAPRATPVRRPTGPLDGGDGSGA